MRKLLLGSAVMTLFAISIIFFQISCQKESNAQSTTYTLPPATTTTLGGVIVGNGLSATSNGTLSVTCCSSTQLGKIIFLKNIYDANPNTTHTTEIWTANYDFSNVSKVNVDIPSNRVCSRVKLSPDGTKIFFSAYTRPTSTTDGRNDIFSCNIDGSNLIKLSTSAATFDFELFGAN